MESGFQVLYIILSIYGYFNWKNDEKKVESTNIINLSLRNNLLLIISTLFVSISFGIILKKYTNASYPIIDSSITFFSIITTYTQAKKILESWLYWMIIDLVSAFIYVSKGLHMTAGLYVIYVLLAWLGWKEWNKEIKKR